MLRIVSATLTVFLSFTAQLLANDLEKALQAGFDAGRLNGLHSVIVRQNGETLAEVYFQGDDFSWGQPLGRVAHGPDTLHDMRSVSKSVVGLLYGIALDKGLVPPVDASLMSQFPEYADLATALIGEVITRGTGVSKDAFAQKYLFAPVGITRFQWIKGNDGDPAAASGLRLSTRELAKIGEMVAAGGVYGGAQIVPQSWVKTSFSAHAKTKGRLRYGYQWWLAPQGTPPNWAAAFGNRGQRLTVVPGLNLVGAITAGNYNEPDCWKVPVSVIQDDVVPHLGLE